jgi:CheY-like chemotaxis protein
MSTSAPESFAQKSTYRILVIDDTVGIHEDIRKILAEPSPDTLASLEELVLAKKAAPRAPVARFEIDSAYQGEEGVECVRKSLTEGRPYALVFLDMRMPPGIDGLETMRHLWQIDTELQIIICTAFSDYTWEQITATTGPSSRLVILRKPFEPIEVTQLAHAMTEKWRLEKQARRHTGELEHIVVERTKELAESQMVFQLILEEKIQETKRRAAMTAAAKPLAAKPVPAKPKTPPPAPRQT